MGNASTQPAADPSTSDDGSYEIVGAEPKKNVPLEPDRAADTMSEMKLEVDRLKQENQQLREKIDGIIDVIMVMVKIMQIAAVVDGILLTIIWVFSSTHLAEYLAVLLLLNMLVAGYLGWKLAQDNPLDLLMDVFRPEATLTMENAHSTPTESIVTPGKVTASESSSLDTEEPTATDNESDATTRTVTLTREDDGFIGFYVFGRSISKVFAGSSAALNGMQRGDQIIAVDGVQINSMFDDTLVKMITWGNKRRVTIELRYNPEQLKDNEDTLWGAIYGMLGTTIFLCVVRIIQSLF